MSISNSILRNSCMAALLSISLAATAHAGEVKKIMKDMKLAMQGALASQNMPDFIQNFTRLQNDTKQASVQTWKADASLYKEGMQKLQTQFDAVEVQVKANNLAAAKQALEQVNPIKKKYHNYLN